MNLNEKKRIANLVYTFADKANITNREEIDKTIDRLCLMSINDSIDAILVSLNDLLARKAITQEDIFDNVKLILELNPNEYKSIDDLINRLNFIKGMNMEHPNMSLTENHELVVTIFDKFNELILDKFDCYYTGGLMGYLATNHKLERYHSDLDLFINEKQLIMLKKLVDYSDDFNFVSNMDSKGINGHEYKIVYKDTEMSVGLFLFERRFDKGITLKEYYYEGQKDEKQLFVNEHHFSKDYTYMTFSDEVRYHNGIPYKMVSLESIYYSKKGSRPKDRYDANIIKNYIDMNIVNKFDIEGKNNFDIKHKPVSDSIVNITGQMIQGEDKKDFKIK